MTYEQACMDDWMSGQFTFLPIFSVLNITV